MDIEIKESGFDPPIVNAGKAGIELVSRYGSGIFQCYQGSGFSLWNNSYYFSSDTQLHARADMPVLELHITRRGVWQGAWEGITDPDFHPGHFNLTYTPHVLTTARFRKRVHYQSCDIHFDRSYLELLSADFPSLDTFLSAVAKGQPSSLSRCTHRCTREMLSAVDAIFKNPFGASVQSYILETKVKMILLEALEKVARDLGKALPVIRASEKQSLQHARRLIELSADEPLTHTELCKQSGLNEFVLKRGFRALFGVSPYQYHVQLKMNRAKEMLVTTQEPLEYIAFILGYSQSSSFGHEFKKLTGLTPAQYRRQAHK